MSLQNNIFPSIWFFNGFSVIYFKFETDIFLKVKNTQFTQLFLAMLDSFIELFCELFIAPSGHSYDIWRQWQLLTFFAGQLQIQAPARVSQVCQGRPEISLSVFPCAQVLIT